MLGDVVCSGKSEPGQICMREKKAPLTNTIIKTLKRVASQVGAQWFGRPQRHLLNIEAWGEDDSEQMSSRPAIYFPREEKACEQRVGMGWKLDV